MKDKNTLGKGEFLFFQFLITCGLYGLYKIIFVSLPYVNDLRSNVILFLIIILSNYIGINLCWEKRRNHLTTMTNGLLPLGIYTVLSYVDLCPILISFVLIMSMAICSMYIILMHLIHTKKQRKTKIFYRYIFLGQRTLAAFFLSSCLVWIPLFHIDGQIPLEPYDLEVSKEEWIAEMDILDKDSWENANWRNRIQLAENIIEIEAKDAGMDHKPTLRVHELEESHLGSYYNRSKVLTLDYDVIMTKDPEFMLQTLLHECRHMQQHELKTRYEEGDVGNLTEPELKQAEAFLKGFRDYKRVKKDGYMAYDSQLVERDADAYAIKNIHLYLPEQY